MGEGRGRSGRVAAGWGPKLFATTADEPRARRATDLVALGLALGGLVALSLAATPPTGPAEALTAFLRSLPDFLDGFWQLAADLLAVGAVLLVVAALLRGRAALARDLGLAAAVALGGALVAGRAVDGTWPAVWEPLQAVAAPPWYLPLRLAVPAAVVLAAAPHLGRPVRRLLRRLAGIAAVAVVVLGATDVVGSAAALLLAAAAAAIVHLVFGSSGGRPSLTAVEEALDELGVPARDLAIADREQAGVFLVSARGEDDAELLVKVYGRDARDSALVATLWRTAWLREPGSPPSPNRLHQVEHEAFLTLLAGQAGIPTDRVVTAGATEEDDAVLVLRTVGTPLADVADADLPLGIGDRVWSLVADLHAAGITHGQLDAEHLVVHDGRVGITDFRGAAAAPTDGRRRADEAQALVTTLLLQGPDVALPAAVAALGSDELRAVLPWMQPSALTPQQRRRLRDRDVDLDAWRDAAADAAGIEAPELARLRRITVGMVIRIVLPALALVALVSAVSGLDPDELADALRGATWWLLVVGALAAQVPRLTQAVSTLGASPIPLPLGPVYALQLAVSYVNLAIPTAAARMAVNIRFFQRHGVSPPVALSAGALDSFAGFLVQASLLVGLLAFTPASLDLDVSGSLSGPGGRLLLLVAGLGALVLVALLVVARWRRIVLEWGRHLTREALTTVRGLRSPRRLLLLFGGNLATEVLFASALGLFTLALGYPIGLAELVLVNVGTALLSGLIPIPGGVGVAEGALTYGLTAAGMPEEAAFTAAICYRIASFYLPPVWGYFAFRWLERNQHL